MTALDWVFMVAIGVVPSLIVAIVAARLDERAWRTRVGAPKDWRKSLKASDA